MFSHMTALNDDSILLYIQPGFKIIYLPMAHLSSFQFLDLKAHMVAFLSILGLIKELALYPVTTKLTVGMLNNIPVLTAQKQLPAILEWALPHP